jgi:ribonucleotide reductase alpha subunit
MSNNSVVCNEFGKLPEQFWEGYKGNGEPYGLINLRLAREIGRTGETEYPDKNVMIFNPCAEQSLANYETCCLAEIFLPNIQSEAELKKVSEYLYRINKHSLALPCHSPETEAIVHKNMRMGIGVTGYMQATAEQKSWLSPTYEHLRDYDKAYSKKHNWPTSIKLCTTKPSGTLSLLAGVTPGCHPGYSQYFVRRIRIASNSPLVDLVKQHGFHIEPQINFDGSLDNNTLVASFPSSYPLGTKLAKDTTAIDQLNVVKELQANWSDNAVSCTIYYKKEELPVIREWLSNNYDHSIKTCSFLLHSDHGFKQAPYEEISESEYLDMVSRTKTITGISADSTGLIDADCVGGACPIR